MFHFSILIFDTGLRICALESEAEPEPIPNPPFHSFPNPNDSGHRNYMLHFVSYGAFEGSHGKNGNGL